MSNTGTRKASLDNYDDYEGYELIARRMKVILPSSWFRASWDWVLIILVLYNLVSIPLEICFLVGVTIPAPVFVLNVLVDTFFIVDVVLNFRTAFYMGAGLSPVIEPSIIAKHYIFGPSGKGIGWFWPDVLAAIPFDWVPTSGTPEAVEALSVAKLGRLFRLGRLIKKLDQFTAARAVRVFNLLIVLLLCTHFFGCFWWRVPQRPRRHSTVLCAPTIMRACLPPAVTTTGGHRHARVPGMAVPRARRGGAART